MPRISGSSEGLFLGSYSFFAALGADFLRFFYAHKKQKNRLFKRFFVVEEGGFEPPKSLTADLQSAPFGRSGTLPFYGAGERT